MFSEPVHRLVERGELTGDSDGATHRFGIPQHVVAGHEDLAGVRCDQGGEDPDHRRLACAVRTEQGEDGPLGHGQVDPVEHGRLAEGLVHTA